MPLYFAYGSNLDVEQMHRRCPGSRQIGVGCLRSYRLDFNRYSSSWGGGVADVVPDDGNVVWGLVYELTREDLDSLDEWEGYPTAYRRFEADIETSGIRPSGVWVYEVVAKQGFVPPTRQYLAIIKDAAEKFEFSHDYRSFLDRITVQEE